MQFDQSRHYLHPVRIKQLTVGMRVLVYAPPDLGKGLDPRMVEVTEVRHGIGMHSFSYKDDDGVVGHVSGYGKNDPVIAVLTISRR